MAQVLGPDGGVVGAGFLLSEDVLVTCAHVVRDAGSQPGEDVRLAFPRSPGAPRIEGRVLEEAWRAPEDEDVAVVRLHGTPEGMEGLPMGTAAGCHGHPVRSFGFPAQAPPGGHFGFGVAGDLLPAAAGRSAYLQLTSANDLTTGFSGGPVVDEVTGLVIGMLTEIAAPDQYDRGQGIAYVTPTQVLREVWPELAEQEVCPYQGLERFTAEQAQWFEGRGEAVRQVLANLAQQQRLTLLLGPSGSGKSSLVEAGVLPALAAGELPQSDRWLPVVTRPRQDLLAELERAGLPGAATEGIAAAVTRRLAADPFHRRVVLVVDQFEELLAQSASGPQHERRLAATNEITAAVKSRAALSVILIMRDDFYPQLAALARMFEAAVPGLLNVPSALSQQDLHDIITLPAERMGARFQPGLPEQIISDVLATTPGGTSSREAPVTVLPLLELALSQLWERRQDGCLTHDAYRRIGGVTGSLTTWCDTAMDQLPPERRPVAQRILTSLVRPADLSHHIPAIREQVPLHELRDLAADPGAGPDDEGFDEVLAVLTRHRIITTHTPLDPGHPDAPAGPPVAELIHDALIQDWGTLREWVGQDHRFQEWFDHTRDRRARWAAGKDPGDLLGGTALAEGLDWSRQRHLPGEIADFLTASRERQQAAIRRSRRLNMVLACLLVLALVAVGGAVWQWRTTVTQRQEALSRQLAAQSEGLLGVNPDLAALLAVRSYRIDHTAEAVKSLEDSTGDPLLQVLRGHDGEVSSVAFSPDGRTLASASSDQSVLLWNVTTGKARPALTGHTKGVESVAFSPDGLTLATSSDDKTVQLWDVATGRNRATLAGHRDEVYAVAFSPDRHTLATGSADNTVRLWDTTAHTTRATLGHMDDVRAVAFSPDGKTLATGSLDGTARLWDMTTLTIRATLKGHTDAVNSVAFSPDGKTLATGSYDGTVGLWDTATGKGRPSSISHTDAVASVAFSPDGKTLATGSYDHTVGLWDPETGAPRSTLAGHTGSVNLVAFSPDGKTLATGGTDKTVRLWDMAADAIRPALSGHTDAVNSVAFSPDGKTLATGSTDKTVRLWDAATGENLRTLKGHKDWVTTVAFSPDGQILASASGDKTVQLWDAATGENLRTLRGHGAAVQSLAFSPDGSTLATGGDDKTVRLWDTATGKPGNESTAYTDWVYAVAFSPDGHTLAIAGASSTVNGSNTVRLWDTLTGITHTTLTDHLEAVTSVAFSPDGKVIATGSEDHTVRLWNVATGKPLSPMYGHNYAVNAVAFSPDGRTIATGGDDWDVLLWDATTGKWRQTLPGHDGAVLSVAFSPDGRRLAIAGAYGTVRLRDLDFKPEAAIDHICHAVNRDLTAQERTEFLPGHDDGVACPSH
ncbi:trypsin-like peptidase domain-containing protein [Streptomyces polychromogenes]|nr:trypsin-like peptidase domain-containing protein [Streptomyces polychromogenes]